MQFLEWHAEHRVCVVCMHATLGLTSGLRVAPRCVRASEGADGARELLTLTPCDLWPYMRGRTLWLVGDSMMQARPQQPPAPRPCNCLVSWYREQRGTWVFAHGMTNMASS